jgi:hypothetical protein
LSIISDYPLSIISDYPLSIISDYPLSIISEYPPFLTVFESQQIRAYSKKNTLKRPEMKKRVFAQ